MKPQAETLDQMATRWGSTYQAHVTFLKQHHSNHYEPLRLGADGAIVSVNSTLFSKATFNHYWTETKLCLSQEGYYYTCLDCSLMSDVGLCKACFDPAKHLNHNWILGEIKGKPYCDCGFSNRFKVGNGCLSHGKATNKKDNLTQGQQKLFRCFFTIYIKLALQKMSKLKNNTYFGNMLTQLTDLVTKNMHYIKVATEILIYPIQNQETTFLQQMVSEIKDKTAFYKPALKLFVELCNSQKFEYAFFEALSLKFEYKKSSDLSRYFFETSTNLAFINDLATKKIFVNAKYNSWNESQTLDFYTGLAEKYHAQNTYGNLCQVWKGFLLHSSKVLRTAINLCRWLKMKSKTIYIFTILQDAVTDQDLFSDLMEFTIQNWIYYDRQGYQSRSQIYNEFVKIGLKAAQGRIENFADSFHKCNKNKLSKFIASYFTEVLDDSRKCKFNSLTAKCLFQVHKKLQLKTMNQIAISAQISPLKLAKTLSVVLRNLTAFQYCQHFELYKVAKSIKNTDLIEQRQKYLAKWLQQYLYMRQQIPKKLLSALRNQGIFSVGKIKNMIENEIRFNKSTGNLQYAGPDIDANPDLLLYRLDSADQIYGLSRKESSQMFYKEDRKQLLAYLLTDVIKRAKLSKYCSYTKSDRYLICVTAVIAEKITQGLAEIKQYIDQLQTLELSIKSNPPVDRLLGLRIKPAVVDVQNISLKQCANEEIKSEKISSQIITISQDITINQIHQKQEEKQVKLETALNKQDKQEKIEARQKIFVIERQENKKSPALLKVLEQSEKKRNRLAQKYASKSKKHLNSPILREEAAEQEVCLVCREVKNDYGPLYYFASIKKNKNSNLFNLYRQNNKNKEEFMVDSCFHTAHINCLKNNGSRKCVLCSTPYDMFIPVFNSGIDPEFKEFIFMSWWNQDFKTVVAKHTNRKTDQEVFMVLFKPFISNLGIKVLTGGKQIKNFIFKNQSFLTFLIEAFRVQTEPNKNKIRSLIEKDINQNMADRTKVISVIEGVLEAAVLNRLDDGIGNEQMAVWIVNELYKIKDSFLFKYCEQILKNVQWLLSVSLEQFKECFADKPTIEQLWQHLQILYHIPPSLLILKQKYYKICDKCKLLCRYLCIMCNTAICDNCVKMRSHVNESGCICVGLDKGQAFYMVPSKSLTSKALYFNFCQQNYNQMEEAQNLDDYKLNKALLYDILYRTLEN